METNQESGAAIEILTRARYPLIYVVSFEEGRVGRRLKVLTDGRKQQLFNWTITNGLFVLHDFHHYLNGPGGGEEWNQLLYKDTFGIPSVDIELPNSFDEGRRCGNPSCHAKKVREAFDGILTGGKGNYYGLLKNYNGIIDEHKRTHMEKK
jgi:hypothetical protein